MGTGCSDETPHKRSRGVGQQHGCISAGQDPPALHHPPTHGAGQHPHPRDRRSPLENGGKNKSSSGERWGRLSRRGPWRSWAGRVAAPWAGRPCTLLGCSAPFCPAAPWHPGDRGCRGCPAAPRDLEGPSSHSLVVLGDLGALVGRCPPSAPSPSPLSLLWHPAPPACLALPAVPLCQSALASLGILGVPAGRAAHPCPGDPVCLGPPPSPPGSASVRCSMPCAHQTSCLSPAG